MCAGFALGGGEMCVRFVPGVGWGGLGCASEIGRGWGVRPKSDVPGVGWGGLGWLVVAELAKSLTRA